MTGKKKKLLLFLIVPLFLSCKGTPPTNDLNSPMGLFCYDYIAGSWDTEEKEDCTASSSQIKIGFYAYNPEPGFTGYNIYIIKGGTPTYEDFQAIVNSRINNGSFTTGGDNYIISGGISFTPPQDNYYPTLPGYNYPEVKIKVIKIETLIEYEPTFSGPNPVAISSGVYYIGVTSLDKTNVVESKISNIIKVTVP
ncbi:MAG TPA: hypothetical protein PKW55_01000 [Spirochaetota bacterium]|nr:hypothetical protein [Spirochaetota bacterium]HOM39190.1 hypothetical protein [Spirochaetota bacterium]HPQ49225.1 hypothetical protein [Spirochaetota bacterium]